ncbi:hypothetical protein LTR35_016682 [Friedmanniomyces endolithicus]|uniref:Phospholipid/glycerol acyltransferase domain-containing protein n=1 Tax=Friedmanniomyces endolithicus TaxID=329885 RepID=A0AAN6FIR6_9PEZI|nr:hypothetical protein LTR35_016682 [Friedmanniomyces endolithicus]KAK0299889.1 hypothetical protein LTS00_001659 [Friedmanniomyces endolithicus]KAK0315690.1 hypothetical protein LTR01_000990 [Friedmanniomyces endolithicus]KAK0317974.1 hypothetical protein LTR82_010964 [Friedmanniomyces endolithicus]KAK0836049.1 hypothetical protein LTR73_000550 [Friedmanniomyces endolithicus]
MAAKGTPSVASGDGGAGMSLMKSGVNNPNPILHGGMGQAERAFSAGSTFLSGLLAISASQFIGAPLKLVDPKFYDSYMAWTKESFAVLMTTITQWWSPTLVRVSGDESMKGQLYQMDDGTLKCNFPHRLVLMANHQLYTDWLYLWWIAYTNKMHGRIYIILKESLKQLPIFGWGAQFYNFIFLSRKWETDKWRFKQAFNHLRNPEDPMWLLIFPEGTNLSEVTRAKSASWAKKSGTTDMKNQLLPRSTGLQFCLQELKASTNWLYDCTIAYEGVPKGMYGQDIYTLKSSFFEGRPPKSVNMYWRRYRIADIPLDNDAVFGRWLTNRWREKDYILEYFYKFGHFPACDAVSAMQAVEGKKPPQHAKAISTEVKGGGWDEFLSIFGPITTAAGALSSVDMTEPLNFDAILGKVAMQQQLNLLELGKAPITTKSQEAIRGALQAANLQKALPPGLMDKLMKELPDTQEKMQKLLANSGFPDIAARAANAPAAKAQLPPSAQQSIRKAALQVQQGVIRASPPGRKANSVSSIPVGGEASNTPRKPTTPNPAKSMQKSMPMANMQAMVTRPLSTMAVQTAAKTLRNAAAQRAKQNGAVLPGQAPPKKASVNGSAVPKKVNGVAKTTSPLTAANLAAAAKKPPAGSKAVGTQKSVNGKVAAAKKPPSGSMAVGTQKYVNGKKA